jgi:hypothetical protein
MNKKSECLRCRFEVLRWTAWTAKGRHGDKYEESIWVIALQLCSTVIKDLHQRTQAPKDSLQGALTLEADVAECLRQTPKADNCYGLR